VSKIKTRALMYHDVVRDDLRASGFVGAGPYLYKLKWTAFLEHLSEIGRHLETPPSVATEMIGRPESPHWLLTFDDGGASAAEIGVELAQRGWRGHFLVTTGRLGTGGFLDKNGVAELHGMGHVVGSHSVTHPARMSTLSFEELLGEWQRSADELAEIVGQATRTASIPGGYYSRDVARAARQSGIEVLFTSEPVRAAQTIDGLLLVGRYSVRRDTSAPRAAAAAAGRASVWLRQYAAWNIRKPLKAIGGDRYTSVRRVLHTRRLRS
jgi:peptidoglycan/xylan/chitin deacetylase (PgdA/CDA1 family)